MSHTILSTKLYIPPPRPNFIPRPHLTERLTVGVTYPLTLIAAPAGFGKSTLLSEWLADSRFQVSDFGREEIGNPKSKIQNLKVA